MSDVPEEILREILSRLPVTPLLRCRCVSKSWKCLIDSDQFIRQHLYHSKSNTKLSIILRSFDLYSADFDLLDQTNRATFKELSHPLKAPSGGTEILGLRLAHPLKKPSVGTEILGSCDGLLALTNDEDDDTIIWNPSVGRFHEVPYTRIEFPEYFYGVQNIVYGFGYDVVSNDYKLVRMVQYYEDLEGNIDTEVKVYCLKSNSWGRILDFPYSLKYRRTHGEFANGALHWIVTRKVKPDTPDTDCFIAAFDLGTEEYRLVPLPEIGTEEYRLVPLPEIGDDDMYMNVAVLGGCLSLMCYDKNEDRVDVWVMKEYGVQESWSILFTVDICDFSFMTPLAYSRCGRKVLVGLDDQVLMWYDLDEKSTNLPMVQKPLEDPSEMYTCLQSLVLLNSGTCDFDLFTKKERKGKKRSSTPRNDYMAKNRLIVFPAAGRPNGHQ